MAMSVYEWQYHVDNHTIRYFDRLKRKREAMTMMFMPFEKATVASRGRVEVFCNRWWLVHPERGIALVRHPRTGDITPMCDDDKSAPMLTDWTAPLTVRQFSAVFVPIDAHGRFVIDR